MWRAAHLLVYALGIRGRGLSLPPYLQAVIVHIIHVIHLCDTFRPSVLAMPEIMRASGASAVTFSAGGSKR